MNHRSLLRSGWVLAPGFLVCTWAGFAWSQDAPPASSPQPKVAFGTGIEAAPSLTPVPSSGYVPAKVLNRMPVAYPTLAHLNRVEGVVTIRFFIDESGHVTKARMVKSATSLLLDQVSQDPRLLQWTFEPATIGGKAVPSTHDQEFEFRLDPEEEKRLAIRRMNLPLGTPDPPYPAAAIARHLEGRTTIAVVWTKLGLVGEVTLIKSSGSALLDDTALRFVYESWRVDPASITTDQHFVKTCTFAPPP